jgi:hypothetical protein
MRFATACAFVVLVWPADVAAQIVTSGGNRSLVTSGRGVVVRTQAPPKRTADTFAEIFAPREQQFAPELPADIRKETRPVIFAALLNAPGCPGCDLFKSHVRQGRFAAADIVYTDRIDGTRGFPQIWYDVPGKGREVLIGYMTADAERIQRDLQLTGSAPRPASTVVAPSRWITFPRRAYWGRIDLKGWRHCSWSRCEMCNAVAPYAAAYAAWERGQRIVGQTTDANPEAWQGATPLDVVFDALDMMNLQPGDTFADLGCGDGRFVIAAARRGIPAIGIEIDKKLAERATRNARRAGVSHLVRINPGGVSDALQFAPEKFGVTAVVVYQHADLLRQLAGKLSPARVAVSVFHPVPGLKMQQRGKLWLYEGPDA